MITLDVAEYCHWCTDFDPEAHKLHVEGMPLETFVMCKNAKRCNAIAKIIMLKANEKQADADQVQL